MLLQIGVAGQGEGLGARVAFWQSQTTWGCESGMFASVSHSTKAVGQLFTLSGGKCRTGKGFLTQCLVNLRNLLKQLDNIMPADLPKAFKHKYTRNA